MKKLLVGLLSLALVVVVLPLFSAFEAHVINVSATIENALRVHALSIDFGTVFPEEFLRGGFSVETSDSFSLPTQTRVKKIDYLVKQKPKPRVDTPENQAFCHNNEPAVPSDPDDSYYDTCYPLLCPYLGKTPQVPNENAPGIESGFGVPHNWQTNFGVGRLDKTLGFDLSDQWYVDLVVPCFEGFCAQDDRLPEGLPLLPISLEHETFGCDIWVEVTNIS